MTHNDKATQHVVPPAELADKLLELVAKTPATIDDLATLTGYSGDTVRLRLMRLEEGGCVRREQHSLLNWGGFQYIWHATGEPFLDLSTEVKKLAMRGGEPHQVTVKAYPTIGRRDPLVASLFGPACVEAT
jgi:DNA-binding IclR family transcriptional regulator